MEKLDYFTVSKNWTYKNSTRLISIIQDKVLEEINLADYNPEERESIYNYIAARNCAKIVGEMFGLKVGFDDSNVEAFMVKCIFGTYVSLFTFTSKFSWMKITANNRVSQSKNFQQDNRVIELAIKKRGEFIQHNQLRERARSWFGSSSSGKKIFDSMDNKTDLGFIITYFQHMEQTFEYLKEKVSSQGLPTSIPSS